MTATPDPDDSADLIIGLEATALIIGDIFASGA